MPTLELSKINVVRSRETTRVEPVIATIIDSQSGITGYHLITTSEEVDLYYPDLKDKQSLYELLDNNCPLYISRISSKAVDESVSNLSDIIIGKSDQNEISTTWNTNSFSDSKDKLRYTKFLKDSKKLNKAECEAIYNKSNTYSIKYKLTGTVIKKGDYLVIPTLDNNQGILVVFGNNSDYPKDISSSLAATTLYVNSGFNGDSWVVDNKSKLESLFDELYTKLTASSIGNGYAGSKAASESTYTSNNDVRIEIDDSGFTFYFKEPKLNMSFSKGYLKYTVDESYNATRLALDKYNLINDNLSNSVCKITSKLPGTAYQRTEVSFKFQTPDKVVVTITFDGWSEKFICTFDKESDTYIEDIINLQSEIISIDWYFDYYSLSSADRDNFRRYLSANIYNLIGGTNYTYTTADLGRVIDNLKNYPYRVFMIYDSLYGNNLHEDSVTGLVNRAVKLNAVIGINFSDWKSLNRSNLSDAKYLFTVGTDITNQDNIKVNSLVPIVRLINDNIFLGDISEYNIIDQRDGLDEALKSMQRANNHYTYGTPNRIDELISYADSDYMLPAYIGLLKVDKTMTTMIENLLPNISMLNVMDIIEEVKLRFTYIDSIDIITYDKSGNRLNLQFTVTSDELNVHNQELNVEITI